MLIKLPIGTYKVIVVVVDRSQPAANASYSRIHLSISVGIMPATCRVACRLYLAAGWPYNTQRLASDRSGATEQSQRALGRS